MANHDRITTKNNLSIDDVDKAIHNLIKRKFKNTLEICKYDEWNGKKFPCWEFTYDKNGCFYQFTIALMSRRKFDLRHPPSQWAEWAQTYIKHWIATKYDGIISDEMGHYRWKPSLNKYRTYEKYLFNTRLFHNLYDIPEDDKKFIKECIKNALDIIPNELKDL